MIKVARKPSTDPLQEKLRQEKAVWNKEVSTFVNDLIHLKKMMNGWPSKFYNEKSSIKEPIPADPVTIIDSLAGDYQKITQQGNKLVQQQLDYSKNRRKRQMKQMNLPLGNAPATPSTPSPAGTPAPDLSKQLALPSVASIDYNLIAEASNPITRFFTRLLTPTSGSSEAARVRKYRMALLEASVKTFKALEKFQVEIVKSSDDSIVNSNKLLHSIWNDWTVVSRGFNTYKNNMPKEVVDSGGDIKSKNREEEQARKELSSTDPSAKIEGDYDYDPEKDESKVLSTELNEKEVVALAKAAIADCAAVRKNAKGSLIINDPNILNKIVNLNGLFQMAVNKVDKEKYAYEIVKEHRAILANLNKVYSANATSLDQLLKLVIEKEKVANACAMEKLAQDFLKKWIGKTRHQYISNKTSAYRLDMYKMAESMREDINHIMDSLEKGLDLDVLDQLISQVNKNMLALRGIMRSLHYSEK